jgi:TolA-binding protein
MSLKKAIFLFVFFSLIIPLSAIQQTPNSSTQAASSQAGAANAAENAQMRQLANTHANDAQALRDDIKRMRALVGQMETNLAFVDTTQSPLKHQFQLDIDMWNIVINQMERRAYPNSR